MSWQQQNGEQVYVPEYRVEPRGDGFEPQMQFLRGGVESWLPLNADGYVLEAEIFQSFGPAQITKRIELTEAEAQRAVTCARRINGERLIGDAPRGFTDKKGD